MSSALIALEAQVRADLAKTAHPSAPWLKPRPGPDAKPALDVLIVGAGQSGIATAFGLMRSQVTNILTLDKAEEGQEGPWLAYARMPSLRSPKHFTGPDLDIPCLTYQSWHEARFGKEHWQNLGLIPRNLWAEYLLWLRRVVGVAVRNGCELLEIAPAADGLLAASVTSAGVVETLYARKIVLATGQEAMGNWTIPEPLRHLPPSVLARASEPIDFEALRACLHQIAKTRPHIPRSEVRVRLRVPLKLRGTDRQGKKFEEVATTDNVSLSGFQCGCAAELAITSIVDVYMTGYGEDYVGKAKIVHSGWKGAALRHYGCRFIEKTGAWVLQ